MTSRRTAPATQAGAFLISARAALTLDSRGVASASEPVHEHGPRRCRFVGVNRPQEDLEVPGRGDAEASADRVVFRAGPSGPLLFEVEQRRRGDAGHAVILHQTSDIGVSAFA